MRKPDLVSPILAISISLSGRSNSRKGNTQNRTLSPPELSSQITIFSVFTALLVFTVFIFNTVFTVFPIFTALCVFSVLIVFSIFHVFTVSFVFNVIYRPGVAGAVLQTNKNVLSQLLSVRKSQPFWGH